MTHANPYQEIISSQLPALQLLVNMGWQYLTPTQAHDLRGGRAGEVVLTGILDPWLRDHNHITYKGQTYAFEDGNIREAVSKLADERGQSLVPTSAVIYDLLTLGTSQTQTIDGDRKSYSLHYIDWANPANNVYHVTDEFSIQRQGSDKPRRPDIVLFVNGIPLVVIECKRPDLQTQSEKAVSEAVSQMIRNQQGGQIPQLFIYAQLLMAISGNDALYGTTSTPSKFWSMWREEDDLDASISDLINAPLSQHNQKAIYDWRGFEGVQARRYFDDLGERLPTDQDRIIYALLRPSRLLEIIYQFIVYDDGKKKIARYQQYFAVKATIRRVAHLNAQGTRTGGVIWHTTGSGKSLTMVMLAKALALHPNIKNPRVVLVTDRVNLDDQLYRTFHNCGKSVAQAQDGKHLVRLVTGKLKQGETRADVITTVINKFDQAARHQVKDAGTDIFVLVDESHRSQYGTMNAKMQRVFPNACFIGFTGTPLTKSEKSTAKRFGDFIHKYPMRQAVEDQAVVPLLYEGRIVEQDVDKDQLERWFERHTANLTDEQKTDLKRKMSRSEPVNTTDQRIQEIAYNIAAHYERNWRGSGFKAQLATANKRVAHKYLTNLRDYGINAALIISPPDTREGHTEVDEAQDDVVQAFWKHIMGQYGTEEVYNHEILSSFSDSDGVEILVVVDKLLTGFDEPRNLVLYIDKPLREHSLLQAIARVNRLYEGKQAGFIIDYRGVLGELNEAMNLYDALAEYDIDDIRGTFSDVSEEIARLPQLHSDLWAIFGAVKNKKDREQLEQFLEPEDRRQHFYETLTDFAGALRVALSTTSFYEETPEKRIRLYKDDLKFFHNLRQSVKKRYAEAIDYREYESRIQEIMDRHIRATDVQPITELVNIFDSVRFDEEVEKLSTPVAKADTILHRLKRTISEHIDEDPARYRKFAELVEETIQAYRQGRIDQLKYLTQAEAHRDALRGGQDTERPAVLSRYKHAPAYYGELQAHLSAHGLSDERVAELAIAFEQIIEDEKITDWTENEDIKKRIQARLNDCIYDIQDELDVHFPGEEVDVWLDRVMQISQHRDRLA